MRDRIVLSHPSVRVFVMGFISSWLSLMAGCGPTVQYKVANEIFTSREQALARLDQINKDVLSSVARTETPVHGTVVVATPTLEQIKAKAVKWTGSTASVTKETMEEMMDYTAVTFERNLQYMAESIERRGLFDTLSRVKDASPETLNADSCDFLVYYYLLNQEVQGWYVKGKSMAEPKPLVFETGKAPGTPRTIAWLDNLESIARASQTK